MNSYGFLTDCKFTACVLLMSGVISVHLNWVTPEHLMPALLFVIILQFGLPSAQLGHNEETDEALLFLWIVENLASRTVLFSLSCTWSPGDPVKMQIPE